MEQVASQKSDWALFHDRQSTDILPRSPAVRDERQKSFLPRAAKLLPRTKHLNFSPFLTHSGTSLYFPSVIFHTIRTEFSSIQRLMTRGVIIFHLHYLQGKLRTNPRGLIFSKRRRTISNSSPSGSYHKEGPGNFL